MSVNPSGNVPKTCDRLMLHSLCEETRHGSMKAVSSILINYYAFSFCYIHFYIFTWRKKWCTLLQKSKHFYLYVCMKFETVYYRRTNSVRIYTYTFYHIVLSCAWPFYPFSFQIISRIINLNIMCCILDYVSNLMQLPKIYSTTVK